MSIEDVKARIRALVSDPAKRWQFSFPDNGDIVIHVPPEEMRALRLRAAREEMCARINSGETKRCDTCNNHVPIGDYRWQTGVPCRPMFDTCNHCRLIERARSSTKISPAQLDRLEREYSKWLRQA